MQIRRNLQSLKTRITLVTFGIFLLGTWSLSFFVGHVLERELTQLLSDQQFSLAKMLAKEIDQELTTRLDAIHLAAAGSGQAMQRGPAAMQRFIEERPVLQSLFNGGMIAYRKDGVAIAETPLEAGRVGSNYLDVSVVATALQKGQTTIGDPILGKKLNVPVFGIATPIRDEHGSIIGALAGVINLGQSNFLTEIMENQYGKSGGYLLIDRNTRQIVTGTDKRRTLERLPDIGVNSEIDRFLDGYEGFAIMVNPLGQKILAADAGIPSARWIVSVVVPTDEAFVPIVKMKQQMLMAASVLTFLAVCLTWWALKRQFLPLDDAVERLRQMRMSDQRLASLPIINSDEIGQLVGEFNRLIQVIETRENALSERDALLRNILATTLDGYWRVSGDGLILEVNDRYAELSGYARDEMISRPVTDFLADPDPRLGVERHAKILATGHCQFEDKHLRKDGTTWHIETSASYNPAGKGEVVAFIRDISERKRAEAALLDSNRKFMALVQQSLVGVYMIRAGRWKYVNPHFAAMFGYACDQELIESTTVSDLVAPEDRELVLNNLRRREGGEIERINYAFTGYRKDGGRFNVEVYGSRIDFEGQPAVMGVALDITERSKAEAELGQYRNHLEKLVWARTRDVAEARDNAEAANRAKSAFLATMSHELRTPLNHIFGFASLLGSDITAPRGKERLSKLKLSANALLKLINEILDYSQLEANQILIDDQNFALRDLFDQLELEHREIAASKGLSLLWNISPLLPSRLRGDPVRLRQILDLLIGNAIKFSDAGTITLGVTQEGEGTQPRSLRFEITDEGIGISTSIQKKLFTLFHQGDNSISRRFGGTGLGLALCKRLVELMAGTIGFFSEPGKGSTFWIAIPLLAADELQNLPSHVERAEADPVTLDIDHLMKLLAKGDFEAKNICDHHESELALILKEQMSPFRTALEGFDFELAANLLRSAIGELAV